MFADELCLDKMLGRLFDIVKMFMVDLLSPICDAYLWGGRRRMHEPGKTNLRKKENVDCMEQSYRWWIKRVRCFVCVSGSYDECAGSVIQK